LGAVSSIFAYFISVFIRVFSFVRISDRFACYSWDYHRSFVFACFLVFIASWVIYTNLDCAAKLVLFGLGLSSARRWDKRCEIVRILRVFIWNTSDVRVFFLPLTNFCRYYHVRTKQHTTPSRCRT
jgi:uncharacterized protein Usg